MPLDYPPSFMVFRLGRGDIQAMDLSPDGQHLAVATSIGLYWYTADTFEQVWFYPTEYPIGCVAIAPDNQSIAFCSNEAVDVLSTSDQASLHGWVMAENKHVTSVHWSPDGAQISIGTIAGTSDYEIAIINTTTGEQLHLFHGWERAEWSPDGSTIALIRYTKTMLIDPATGQEKAVIPSERGIAWAADGKATFGLDGAIRDATTGSTLFSVDIPYPSGTLAWSPTGDTIATIGGESHIFLMWNANTGQLLHSIYLGYNLSHSLAFSPDGQTLYSGSYEGVIAWNVQSGNITRVLQGHVGAYSRVVSVAWSPDGKTVALGSEIGSIVLWDVESQTRETAIDTDRTPPHQVGWSTDGAKLLVNGRTLYEGFRGFVWDTEKRSFSHPTVIGDLFPVAWSPDGAYYTDCKISEGPAISVRLHDTQTDSMIWERQIDRYQSHAWSPDGQILAVGIGKDIELLSASTGQTLRRLSGHEDEVSSIAWFSDSRRFISGSKDGVLLLWDAQSGQLIQKLDETGFHPTVSPDGTMVAIAGEDNLIDVFFMDTGLAQLTFRGHTRSIDDMAWSPDGSMLVSASEDGTVIFWKVAR